MIPLPGLYCISCGYDNPTTRGACLMCSSYLLSTEAGRACTNCAAHNPRKAHFCRDCGTPLEPGAIAFATARELAAKVLEAVGGVGPVGPTTQFEGAGGFLGESDEGLVGAFGEFEEAQSLAPPPPVAQKPPAPEVPAEVIPGPILETPAPTPSAQIEADEDFTMPPPGSVTRGHGCCGAGDQPRCSLGNALNAGPRRSKPGALLPFLLRGTKFRIGAGMLRSPSAGA